MDNEQESLTIDLFRAGLIQVGIFTVGGRERHVHLRLEMLPSYPNILRAAAHRIEKRLQSDINRIICSADAIALGTTVSLITGLPLVWHTGTLGNPSRNFIGAYNIEHPSAFLTLTATRYTSDDMAKLKREAESVGLQIEQHISLIDDTTKNSTGLIDLAGAIDVLMDAGLIPDALGQKALAEV